MKTTFKVLGYVYHAGVLFLVFCCCTVLAEHIEAKDRHKAEMAQLTSKLDELTAQADLNNTGLVVVQSQILELIEGVNLNVAHGDAAIALLQQRLDELEARQKPRTASVPKIKLPDLE